MSPAFQPKQYFNVATGEKVLKLISSIAACLSAGVISSFFTVRSVNSWYLLIEKPPITPPGWVFAPVWSTLYVLMGIAFFLVWKQNLKSQQYKDTLTAFIFQLLLNTSWSIVFFGFRSISGGLIVIVCLWISIAWTIKRFFLFSKAAALLLFPYMIWVSFALLLNLWIFLIN